MTSPKPSRKNKTDATSTNEAFQLLFANHPTPMWVYDLKTLAFLDVNDAALEKYGYTRDEFMALTIKDIRPAEDMPRLVSTLEQKRTELHHSGEWRHRLKNGQFVDVEITTHTLDFEGHKAQLVTAQDITERKRVEEALRESEGKWYSLVSNTPDFIALCDHEGKYLFLNHYVEGFTEKDVIGTSMYDYLAPESKKLFRNKFESCLNTWTAQKFDFRAMGGDSGTWRDYEEYLVPLKNKDNETILLAVARDITERKQIEEKYRAGEERYRNLIENMDDIVMEVDAQGNFCYVSPNYETLSGYSLEKEFGGSAFAHVHPDDLPSLLQKLEQVLLGMEQQSMAYRVQNKNGEWRWLETSGKPYYTADGSLHVITVARDITERKRTEKALHETTERLAHMLANSPTVIYALKVEGEKAIPVWISDNISAILGFNENEGLQPEWWPQRIHPEDRSKVLVSLEHLFDDYYQHEYRFLRKDGSMIWLHDEHRLLRNTDNKPWEIIGTWTDITTRKQAEEALQEYNNRLEAAVEARTSELRETQEKLTRQEKLAVLGQLAGGVGHELRNPLAVINNAVYYLKLVGANNNEKMKEYLGIIETEAHTAEKIITDLLDFARIKSVEVEAVSAFKLAERVLGRYPAPKTVSVRLEIPEDLPMLYVDPHQMEQVLGNLIINACQAMSAGGELTITARQEQGMMAMTVKDTGVGIATENMKKLFEPLFTTKAKGVGLGLAVSQKLAEANGGRIEVQSETGKGSTFTVWLPVKQ